MKRVYPVGYGQCPLCMEHELLFAPRGQEDHAYCVGCLRAQVRRLNLLSALCWLVGVALILYGVYRLVALNP